jgi:hypothetical protein
VGRLTGIEQSGAQDLWVVAGEGREHLIPAWRRSSANWTSGRRVVIRRKTSRPGGGRVAIDIVTLFPAMVEVPLAESMLGRARQRGLVDIRVANLRDHAVDRHRTTDDYQFGGGGGMVLKPEPLFAAVAALKTAEARVVLMDPRGRRSPRTSPRNWAGRTHLILLAGRYEGVDERVRAARRRSAVHRRLRAHRRELPALVVTDAARGCCPVCWGRRGGGARVLLQRPPGAAAVHPAGGIRGRRCPTSCSVTTRASRAGAGCRRWRTWQTRRDLPEGAALTAEERGLIERFEHGETPDDVR